MICLDITCKKCPEAEIGLWQRAEQTLENKYSTIIRRWEIFRCYVCCGEVISLFSRFNNYKNIYNWNTAKMSSRFKCDQLNLRYVSIYFKVSVSNIATATITVNYIKTKKFEQKIKNQIFVCSFDYFLRVRLRPPFLLHISIGIMKIGTTMLESKLN